MKINSTALFISTILTMIFIVILTITSELSQQFKSILVSLAGHHWIAKSILSLLFFALAYALFKYKKESPHILGYAIAVVFTLCASVVTIFLFNALVFFGVL